MEEPALQNGIVPSHKRSKHKADLLLSPSEEDEDLEFNENPSEPASEPDIKSKGRNNKDDLEQYRKWLARRKADVKKGLFSMNMDEQVIEFEEGTKEMTVAFNHELVALVEEAQKMSALGFDMPPDIAEVVQMGSQLLVPAKKMVEISRFHNTVGETMVRVQRPMMLEEAVALSKLVKDHGRITWGDPVRMKKFIDSLMGIVESLGMHNRVLTQAHYTIMGLITKLFDTDLVKSNRKWRDSVKEMIRIVRKLEDEGFKNAKGWHEFIDHQFYKVLDVKYKESLLRVGETMPEIRVDVACTNDLLQFKPSLEEIRTTYRAHIKKIVNLPNTFEGTIYKSEFFSPIITSDFTLKILKTNLAYEDKLFEQLEDKQLKFKDWLLRETLDLDKRLYAKGKPLAGNWDEQFRFSKQRSQEIAMLSFDEEKFGCFIISYYGLRLEIELRNREYWDALSRSLSSSVAEDMHTLAAFVVEGTTILNQSLQSMEDITESSVAKEKISERMQTMEIVMKDCVEKNQLLMTWIKSAFDLTELQSDWREFEELLGNHQILLNRQIQNIKINLNNESDMINVEIDTFKIKWDQLKPTDSEVMKTPEKLDEAISFITEMQRTWHNLASRKKELETTCRTLGVGPFDFPAAAEVQEDLTKFESSWGKVSAFRNGLKEFETEDWVIFRARPHRFEEFLDQWHSTLRADGNMSPFIVEMFKAIEDYRIIVHNLRYIRGDIFTEKHWAEMFSVLQMQQKPLAYLKAGDFLGVRSNITKNIKQLQDLNSRATGEITVRQALTELDTWEIDATFQLAEHKDSHDQPINIIQDFKSVVNKLGDNQSLLQSIRTSPFYYHFSDRISIWETKLTDLDEYIQNLSKIQRRWIYLEPVFSHGVLEAEQIRFRKINEEYRLVMQEVTRDSRVVSLYKQSGIRNRLSTLVDQLSRCQTSLNEFLEKKRSGFPRFYFLGDDDLLEILGQSTKPMVIQAHLKKLFAGIYNVDFDESCTRIMAMKSLEGEVVPLKSPVKINPRVEEWLNELSNEMRLTLKSMLLDSVADSKHNANNPHKYPSQILCLSNAVVFTDQCEEAIRSGKLQSFLNNLREDLNMYTSQRMKESSGKDKVLELKLKDLILDVIHNIEVVEYLIARNVRQSSDWYWHKQLRFYIREDGTAMINMADAQFSYSYEYQGNAPKLVHTPLTDKCYLTLTQGMRMGLGGNPYGPAGTGKTESVKALGGILGRQVLVFNCDEGIDVKSMGRIFTGLVKCGAWGCFDEFNRLDGLTLSAVSLQIQPIQMALKQGSPSVTLMDALVPLDPSSGIFVTLNPAGQGYGGRNKLPDNLKQLFRPVVMSQPDNTRIAEVILYTEGFKYAAIIGKKLVEVFKVAEKLLTPQTHYDWGLRALKTVLKGCGSALAEYKRENPTATESDESNIVVATLRLNTLPKLTYSDCLRFDNLIKDVFSNAIFKNLGNNDLAENVRAVYADLHLKVNENQVRKCLELYEQLEQRMGVVIVGPSCCGKSTVLTVLRHALLRMGHQIRMHVINPKAMPKAHLLGHINLDTRQWTDGILTMKAQQVYAEPPEITSWIVCDGDIDPEWVESLNSVLDDNRLLTLPSGWRIKFGPNVNFIFETHDLSLASPATVSRMGMIFMSEEDADVENIILTWISKQPSEKEETHLEITRPQLLKALSLVKNIQEPIIPIPSVALAKTCLSLMERVRNNYDTAEALIRGISGHLTLKLITPVANEILKNCDLPEMRNPKNVHYNPTTKQLDQYVTDNLIVDEDTFEPNNYPLVKTADVKLVLDHIRPWLDNQESFMLIGPEGCGKTMILSYAFKQLRSTEVATIHCSGLITPDNVLQKLSQICITMSTNTGRVYKSKDGDRLILYFKDINLIKPDKWGTCQLVEFLRQIIIFGGFFDKNLEWVSVQGIQIVCSIAVGESGGRYPLSPRFTSRIHICSMSEPESDQLLALYHNYLSLLMRTHWPRHPVASNPKEVEALANGMVRVYNEVRKTFTPVTHSHYLFTPRDLTKWTLGLMRYAIVRFIDNAGRNELYYTWCLESCRIFRDKLVSDEEKIRFTEAILLPVASQWGFTSLDSLDEGVQNAWWISCYATNIISPVINVQSSPLFGEELVRINNEDLEQLVEKGIAAFGRENRNLNIVIIRELVECVVQFDRILTLPSSCMLLAGRAGVGRRSALSIVSILHHAMILTLKVGRNYSMKSFKTDVKAAIQISAIEGNQVYLVVEDFQLIDIIFLDMINSLISSGEIPGLYTPEELENIVSTLRDMALTDGYTSNLYSYFAQRVRNNLHVILIMDYTNENFIKNCQSNPALYKLCHMLWLDGWSEETMKELPMKIMQKLYNTPETRLLQLDCAFGFTNNFDDDESRERFFDGFQKIYDTMDINMKYPRRYSSFIYNYALLYRNRRLELSGDSKKFEAGIAKLEEATTIVEELKAEAAEQETILAEKQAEANKAMDMISITLKNSNVQKGELEELRKKTEQEKEILAQKKAAIEVELSEIEPMVKLAQAAVGNIKNEALTEIRSLRAPPEIIRDILEGVLRLMGTRDMSWNSMKTFLSKRGVKEDIRNFDARSIDSTDRDAVEKILKLKQSSFDPKNAKRASAAAAPLAEWVVANVKFAKVLEKIDPLERYKEALEHNLTLTETDMNEISSDLTSVDEKVKALTERYKRCSSEAVGIQFNLNKAKSTLSAAEGLVGKLNEEYTRWTEELEELEESYLKLPFDAMMASAFITYLSNASEDVRATSTEIWCKILGTESFDFCKFLGKEVHFLRWQSYGLPSDTLSRENAIMITETCLRPYLVDPSNRATEWLITQMSAHEIKPVVISLQDPKFAGELELAVRFGKIIIVIEADAIEPILIPVLRGDLVSLGSREVLAIGDKMIDYNAKFRLYLATRNPSPLIPPDAQSVVTVVNFTTTRAGLTSNLLSATLSSEHPSLSKQNEELISTIESLKLEMEEVGNTLLRELADAEGNILENKELLASLNETKANALRVAEKLREASEVEIEISQEIDEYRPLADFGSKLYFSIVTVSQLNPLYQFSLRSFILLFETTLNDRMLERNGEDEEHMTDLLKTRLFESTYTFVCQALYKTDRMAFALHLANTMFPGKFHASEWDAFTGQLVMNQENDVAIQSHNVPAWVPEDRRFPVKIFMTTFPQLYEKLQFHRTDLWTQFYNANDCEEALPAEIKSRLTPFQEVLLINILRPDRLLTCMYNFARGTFGRKSLYPSPPGLKELAAEVGSGQSILLLVSAGSDPSLEIREVAEHVVGLDKYMEIPLGQGSLDDAFLKLRTAAEKGYWTCIKNLHLTIHLLDALEKQIRSLQCHRDFRLWLTSESHPGFPKVLAQTCYKFAYESPEGIKKNIQHTFTNWTPEYFTGNKNTMRCQALFMLATFHAIVQERRTYIPQGWSTCYEFNDSDIRAGCDVIEQLFKAARPSKDIQWNYIHGIFENAIYGGRIDNEYDSRVLVTYLQEYFNNEIITGGNMSRKYFGPNITLPSSINISNYLDVVESIPENDRPSFFGLPRNIEKSWQKNTSALIINQLKVLSRGFNDIVSFDKDVWSKELTPIMFLWKKLAQGSTIYSLFQKPLITPTFTEEELAFSPIDAFVQLEHFHIFVLIQKIHRSLGFLSRVIRGVVIPTQDSYLTAQALMIREVPLSWKLLWDGPHDSSQYISGLIDRAIKVNDSWLAKSKDGILLSQGICLSDLINPDTFFTAFKQHCARKRNLPMDELELSCTWERNSTVTSDKLYCVLRGILLEGCLFKGGKLIENCPEDPPASEAPDCFITWEARSIKSTPSAEIRRRSTTLAVPLYTNDSRKKLIGSLDLPIQNGDEVKWIKTGIALFLK